MLKLGMPSLPEAGELGPAEWEENFFDFFIDVDLSEGSSDDLK